MTREVSEMQKEFLGIGSKVLILRPFSACPCSKKKSFVVQPSLLETDDCNFVTALLQLGAAVTDDAANAVEHALVPGGGAPGRPGRP